MDSVLLGLRVAISNIIIHMDGVGAVSLSGAILEHFDSLPYGFFMWLGLYTTWQVLSFFFFSFVILWHVGSLVPD